MVLDPTRNSNRLEGTGRLRPLNIIQHDDGDLVPNTPAVPAEEVVELPPSYNDVLQAAGNAPWCSAMRS